MYESLTAFIPKVSKSSFGKWAEQHGDGTSENPFNFPFVIYEKDVRDLEEEIYQFVREHPKMGLNDYGGILERSHIEWDMDSMMQADVSSLDGRTVMALLVGAIRAERFCDGALLEFCRSGCILRWLQRLNAINETRG